LPPAFLFENEGVKLKLLNNKKVVVPLCFAIFLVIVLLPPIMYGYTYPNLGDDSATHLGVMQVIQLGKPIVSNYYCGGLGFFNYVGHWLFGYGLRIASNFTHLKSDKLSWTRRSARPASAFL